MSLPTNLKDLYVKWLDEFIEKLSSRQEQLNITYNKAKKNLEKTEGTFYYPQDLKIVKGIGNTIIKRLEARLEEYCKELNVPVPDKLELRPVTKRRTNTTLRVNNDVPDKDGSPKTKKRKTREYIPKKRSGGYGILLGLLELRAFDRGVSKDDVVNMGQKFTDVSMMPNYSTKEFYGAWSSISSLRKHDLVLEEGRPKRYSLTEKGIKLAETLKLADSINFESETQDIRDNEELHRGDENEVSADLSALCKTHNIERKDAMDSSFMETTFHSIITSEYPQKTYKDTRTPTKDPVDNVTRRRFEGVSYEIWSRGSYEIYPLIDHREIKSQNDREFFANAFARKGMKSEIKQLSLGDIIWIAKNKRTDTICVLNTIIERKRLDDLAMSIRDNRFMEQKNRLENSGCTNKYYLIEETMSGTVGTMSEALKTALWSILIYYRFSIIRTSNSDQTVDKLHALHTVIERQYAKKDIVVIFPKELENQQEYKNILQRFKMEFSEHTELECCHTFETFQDIMGKRDMRTIAELTIQILMYVRGVSLEKAIAIQNLYPTLSHLLTAYRSCKSDVEAKNLLYMKLGQVPGNKKITKNLSEKIAAIFSEE